MRIYTLTLCPVYDVHATAKTFAVRRENTAEMRTVDASGKGVNISRALFAGGAESTAVLLLGRENDGLYRQELERCGFSNRIFVRDGRIRENMTIHCADETETRICFEDMADCSGILDTLLQELTIDGDTIVTVTGRLPKGVTEYQRARFVQSLKAAGVRVVIDSKSFSFGELAALQPWLIKPNQEEIAGHLGRGIGGMQDLLEERGVIESLGIENVLVSLGGEGAVLFHAGNVYTARAPSIAVRSTIGAGDSMIAGFLIAACDGRGPAERLKTAVVFGTAACLAEGTQPPKRTDIEALYKTVRVEKSGLA